MRFSPSLLVATLLAAIPAGASAQIRKADDPLSRAQFTSPKLALNQPIVPYGEVAALVPSAVKGPWQGFLARQKGWGGSVDRRTGAIAFASGAGIPWVRDGASAELPALEHTARDFVNPVAAALGVDAKALVLDKGRSTQGAPNVWFVDFDVVVDGAPIEGARVVFRVNNGYLIQFGSEYLPSAGMTAPPARLDREQALAVAAQHVHGFTAADSFSDRGSLHLIPIDLNRGETKAFAFGKGRGLARVWQFVFRREGVIGTFRARVDATTGELLELRDVNRYQQATGGVASDTTAGTEVLRPMPFVDLGGGAFANSAGLYTFGGTPLTSTLSGQLVDITDSCGAVSLTSNAAGDLPFGSAAGSNCATPGGGGAGNTRSARTSYYALTRGKEIALGWLPGNVFLNGQLAASVNLSGTCNGYWNGVGISLFRAVAGSCGASGEEPGFVLHEFGHGIDSNDGSGSSEGATGESYGDLNAAFVLHNSCVGAGFNIGNCTGYGDACTACTGLRDIDWAKHASNTAHTVDNFSRVHCNILDYTGPCGYSAHCEAYVPSEAVWDFVNRDLPNPGTDAAWAVGERLFYSSRPTATTAYTCNTTLATWTSNGCNAGSLWETFRALDDDDGNLANGTPHGAALFAAFNRHGMACASDPGASTTFSGCTPPATPAVTVAGGTNQVSVSWTASAGATYDVFRNEAGCDAAFTKLNAAPLATTTFTDSAVANGTTYYYQVVAFAAGNPACAAPPSACQAANLGGPDPSIRPWGASLDPQTPPLWQTPDIWVDNNGNGVPNEMGEPSRGLATNHLFGRVTNTGNAATSGYRVSFAAKPYTTNASAPAAAIGFVDEPGPLAPGASQASEVTWDLTDTWIHASFDPMFWTADHYCVQVTIGAGAGPFNDVDTANDFAQNNFANIPLVSGRAARARFFVYNHLEKAAVASLEWRSHTRGWSVRFEQVESPKRIMLKARQWQEVVAILSPPQGARLPRKGAPVLIDVVQRLDGKVVGGLTLALQAPKGPQD